MTCCVVGAECKSPGIAARTLANIADVLGAMSRGAGGLRSGPASNEQWNYAFQLLEVCLKTVQCNVLHACVVAGLVMILNFS